MTHTTISQRFQVYLATVYTEDPPQRGTVQYQELQRCFMGAFHDGVYSTLSAIEANQFRSAERWLEEGLAFGKLTGDGTIKQITE